MKMQRGTHARHRVPGGTPIHLDMGDFFLLHLGRGMEMGVRVLGCVEHGAKARREVSEGGEMP